MDYSKLKSHWEETAKKQSELKKSLTHSDQYLPFLESEAILSNLKETDEILEIGCGACDNSLPYIKKCKSYIGVDVIDTFVDLAKKKISDNKLNNATVINTDGLEYIQENDILQNVLITQRFIINLKKEAQLLFFKELRKKKSKLTRIIICEGFNEELLELNRLRKIAGLDEIKVAEYNNFLDKHFIDELLKLGYKIVKEINFNIYFFITRIFNNKSFVFSTEDIPPVAYEFEKMKLFTFDNNISYSKILILEL
jgi:hypothetical protein